VLGLSRAWRICAGVLDDAQTITPTLLSISRCRYREVGDLVSTLRLIGAIFGGNRVIRWEDFTLKNLHPLLVESCPSLPDGAHVGKRQSLPTDIHGFIHFSRSRDPLPPVQVIADCLLILDMIIGDLPNYDDKLFIKDKRFTISADFGHPITLP